MHLRSGWVQPVTGSVLAAGTFDWPLRLAHLMCTLERSSITSSLVLEGVQGKLHA